jgi:hypothetical protein
MKKFKNTLNKAEPVKPEPAKAGPLKITAAKPAVPKIGGRRSS